MYFFLSKFLAPFLNLVNLLVFFLIGSYFLKKFFLKKTFKIINYLILFLLIIFSLFPIGKKLVNTLEKDFLISEMPINYEYIVVLGGSELAYTSSITNKLSLNSSSERLIASVKLANEKKNRKIIFLGGTSSLLEQKNIIDETDVAKKFFRDVNFDLKRVIFVKETKNTIENLKKLKKLNLRIEGNSILITSAFHMKRALLISEKLDLILIPYAVDFRSFEDSGRDGLINYYQMFSIVKNLKSLNLYFRELLGIIAVKISM